MKLWHKKDTRQNAQQLINFLLSEHSGSGLPIEWKTMAALEELSYSAQAPLSHRVILRILNKMVEDGLNNVEDFEQIYKKLQHGTKRKADIKRWRYLLPLELEIPKDKLPVRLQIFGKRYYLISSSSFKRYLKPKSLQSLSFALSSNCSFQKKIDRYVYFSALADAPNWNFGWKQSVSSAFDAFRGMLNLTLSFYQWRLTFNAVKSWGIKAPCWGVALTQDEDVPFFFLGERGCTSKFVEISEKTIEALKKNLFLLNKYPQQGSTLELIADALRLYAQAMDTSLPDWRFLGFWQLAEAITISEDVGGDTTKVAHRLSWLGPRIGLEASGYRYTLVALGKQRNQFVHKGIGKVEEEDINILKLACEAGIHWLFSVVKDLPTIQHIKQFYRLKDINQKERQSIKQVLEFINNL